MIKDKKKQDLKHKKWVSPCYNKPVNTHDTAVQVHGVSWCAKNQNHTRTHCTHLGNTVGLPVPVLNPIKEERASHCNAERPSATWGVA